MADYITKNIRNIVLLGHGSTGKTSLVEAMLRYGAAVKAMEDAKNAA